MRHLAEQHKILLLGPSLHHQQWIQQLLMKLQLGGVQPSAAPVQPQMLQLMPRDPQIRRIQKGCHRKLRQTQCME
jgi:hypothetical protein